MNQEVEIRELFSQALDGDEPQHRDMAEGSILRGDRARKRNRIVGAGGGAVLTAAAVFGTMALSTSPVSFGADAASRGSWVPTVNLNIGDKVRDVNANLPALLNKFLPAGVALSWSNNIVDDPMAHRVAGSYEVNGSSFTLTSKDGRDNASFVTVPAGAATPAPFGEKPVAKTTPVPGGSVTTLVLVMHNRPDGAPYTQATYVYQPTDASKPAFAMSLMNERDHPGLSPDEFVAMAGKAGFEQVRALVDDSVPASAAAMQERSSIDAEIAKTVAPVIPAGFTLKLATSNLYGQYELAGPAGWVGVDWHTSRPETNVNDVASCGRMGGGTGGYSNCSKKAVPGGYLIEQHYNSGPELADTTTPGRVDYRTEYDFWSTAKNTTTFWVQIDSGNPQTVLTADQFLAMAQNPAIATIVNDVKAEAAK